MRSPSHRSHDLPFFALSPLTRVVRLSLGAGLAVAAAGVAAQAAPSEQAPRVAQATPAAQTTPSAQDTPLAQAAQASPDDQHVLPTVIVYGRPDSFSGLQKTYSGGQLARGGYLGILGVTDLMNVPFSTTNYTSELILNQQARSIADVVMNDASVRTLTARGGFGDDFQIRGLQVGNADTALNGLLGLTSTTRVPLEMIERVEVLKGPGALVNGVGPNGGVGGSINLVTKRATDAPLTRLEATYMGEAQFGAHLDVGRRFGSDNEWGVRFNGVVRGGEGNIEGGTQNLNLGALGIDYDGSRTRWSLDLLATDGKTDEFRPQISFSGTATAVPEVPDPRSNFYPGQELRDHVRTISTRLEHNLNDRTMVYLGGGYNHLYYKQNLASANPGPDAAGNFKVRNAWYDQDTKAKAADIGLRTRLETGPVGHTLVLGANWLKQDTGYFYYITPAASAVDSNLYNPLPLPVITVARGDTAPSASIEQTSLAAADTMSLADDRVLLTLGLRRQTMKQQTWNVSTGVPGTPYDASAVTPLAGVVVKPLQNVSVYANYTAGLTRGAIAPVTAANKDEVFPPQKSRQTELGVKVDWGRLTTQAALYQIKRPGSFTDAVTQVFSFGGEQTNRGLELTAYGELQPGLRLMASGALQDAEQTRTNGGVNQGKDPAGVPRRTANLGLDWDAPFLPGLSLNGRVIHTSDVYANATNTLRVDGWTRMDLGARYVTRIAGKPVSLRASLENVTGEKYWVVSNYVTVGAPRTLMVSAAVDF